MAEKKPQKPITKTCEFCDKTEWTSQGAYNLHLDRCELKYLKGEALRRAERGEDHEGETDKSNGGKHKHEWVLLSNRVPEQRAAIEAGYLRYCVTCDDLGK